MGLIISIIILIAWIVHFSYSLFYLDVNFKSLITYLNILIQALYTGQFITAHNAMHKTVSKNKFVNNFIGTVSTLLYAGMSFCKLKKNHFEHHKNPGCDTDPDFFIKSQNFFLWLATFMIRYTSFQQIVIMGIAYNILKIWVNEINFWFYWIIPAFLSSLQLFYFGTYLPHRKPHTNEINPHKARTQKKNHLWAMISCYFFGYHYEHHEKPHVLWWKLYLMKN